ncbi:MAG: FMN-binding protein [Calditrichaeota bacterium]|nr:FMN-binding protein [Calditrichota bacterium]
MNYLKIITIIFVLCLQSSAGEIRELTENKIHSLSAEDAKISFQKISLKTILKSKIEKEVRQRFFKDWLYIWKVMENDSVTKYAVLDNVYGKAMPITFLTILDNSGKIKSVRVIKYRESIGGQITNPKWLKQFTGKSVDSDFSPGKDVDAISGATISVNALTKGIQKIVMLFPFIQKNVN